MKKLTRQQASTSRLAGFTSLSTKLQKSLPALPILATALAMLLHPSIPSRATACALRRRSMRSACYIRVSCQSASEPS